MLRKKTTIWLLGLSMLLMASATMGQTITVTTDADAIDINAQTGMIEDLPGPDGVVSLSEALIAANNTPGHQTIGFAVPEGGWLLQFLFPGRVVFTSISGFYWRANEEVTIDGTTQTAAIGDTNPDGGEIVIYGDDLFLNAPNCTLIGFDSSSVFVGSDSLIQGNTGSMNITVGGSRTRVEGNSGGTIGINGDDHVVVGNTVQRVRVLSGNNNTIGGPDPEDRNFITGYGTWNSSGLPSGTILQVTGTVGTVIENNYIGTTPDGLAQGNLASTIGVSIESNNHDLVLRDNLIAGINAIGRGTWAGYHFGWGVLFWGSGGGSNFEVTGNTIGLDANGDPLLGSVWGINVGDVNGAGTFSDVQIQGNVVAGHILNGITVGRQNPNTRMSENSVHGNGWLGIDLIPTDYGYDVTPNDPLDIDTGANGLQNYPEILTATNNGGQAIDVAGQLNSLPSSEFTLEFFASPECDPSGFGEGQRFLGGTTVFTDAFGDATFDVSLPAIVPSGWVITSTATLEPVGATSEFSACVPIEPGVGPVWASSGTLVEGTGEVGDFNSTRSSDDTYWSAHGASLFYQIADPVVQFELSAIAPAGFGGSSISIDVEASKQNANANLNLRAMLFNFTTGSYVSLQGVMPLATTDAVQNFALPGGADPADFVEPGTNDVRLLLQTIQTSGLPNVRTQLDEVLFNFE